MKQRKSIIFALPHMMEGGIQISLLRIIDSLKDKYEVTIALEKSDGCLINKIKKDVKIIETLKCDNHNLTSIKKITLKLAISKFYFYIPLLFASLINKLFKNDRLYKILLARIVIKIPNQKYDVAVSFGQPGSFSLYYVPFFRSNKYIAWIHGDSSFLMNKKGISAQYNKYDHIYCVSKASMAVFNRLCPQLKNITTVCYTPIDVDYIIQQSKLEKISIEKHKLNILTVARLSEEKGIDLVIDAAVKLKKSGADFCWIICGGGDKYKYYSDKANHYDVKDCLIFLGHINNPYPYYEWANIYVQPSKHEGYCLSLAESRIFKNIFIISTDFPAAYEVLQGCVDCDIVKKDSNSIVHSILRQYEKNK